MLTLAAPWPHSIPIVAAAAFGIFRWSHVCVCVCLCECAILVQIFHCCFFQCLGCKDPRAKKEEKRKEMSFLFRCAKYFSRVAAATVLSYLLTNKRLIRQNKRKKYSVCPGGDWHGWWENGKWMKKRKKEVPSEERDRERIKPNEKMLRQSWQMNLFFFLRRAQREVTIQRHDGEKKNIYI